LPTIASRVIAREDRVKVRIVDAFAMRARGASTTSARATGRCAAASK
jgi:hypothetical protein